MENSPHFSIVIPTFNRANIIGKTLTSVVKQNCTSWECIVVDDDSKDETETVLKEYQSKDSRFQYFKRPKNLAKGANTCRNFGFEKSKGKYVLWLDSDDLLNENALKRIETNLNHDSPELIMGNFYVKNMETGQLNERKVPLTIGEDFLHDFITKKIPWHTSSCIWRRDFLEGKTVFNTQLSRDQDYECYIRLVSNVQSVKFCNQFIITYNYLRKGSISYRSISWNCSDLASKYVSLKTLFTLERKIEKHGVEYELFLKNKSSTLLKNALHANCLNVAFLSLGAIYSRFGKKSIKNFVVFSKLVVMSSVYFIFKKGRNYIQFT